MAANTDSTFSVKEVPWHGLGTIIEEPILSHEAIEVAGLDWEVEKVPLQGVVNGGEAVIRSTKQLSGCWKQHKSRLGCRNLTRATPN